MQMMRDALNKDGTVASTREFVEWASGPGAEMLAA